MWPIGADPISPLLQSGAITGLAQTTNEPPEAGFGPATS